MLWIPRVLLSPLYVANEYVVRRPLGAFVIHAERDRWSDSVAQLFTFGEGGHNLLVPTASFDLGLAPSVGVYYALGEAGAADNRLAVQLATWGLRSIRASAADTYAIDEPDQLQARLELERVRDHLFVGVGPDATRGVKSRYGVERVEGSIGYRRRLTGAGWLAAESGVRRIGFVDGCCGDPTLDERIARGEVMAPPGYRGDYTAGFGRVAVQLDTRRARPAPGSGVYLRLTGGPSVAPRDRAWIHYGGVAGGALDLTGHRRTVELQLAVDFVDAMAGAVPFTEYPTLGGESMPAAQLGYTWPVWLGLDARTRFTLGNAWDSHLAGFSPRELRMSGDVGFTTTDDGDRGLEILVGVGTETFERGAHVTSLRVTVGWRPSS